MKDQYQRVVDYIRISVTDRCNYRCQYCMPREGVEPMPHSEVMTYDEILRVAKAAAGAGLEGRMPSAIMKVTARLWSAMMRRLRSTSGSSP